MRPGGSVVTIARLTFREAYRRRLVLAVAVMSVVFLILFSLGFSFVDRNARFGLIGERSAVVNFLLLSGLYVVNFLVVVLTVLASVDTMAGEIASGTLQTVVTKPLRRWEVVVGKWLGLATMVTVFAGGLGGALLAIVYGLGGYLPPSPLQGIGLMILEGLVLLSLSLLGGTWLTTMANGVVVFMLYGLAFISGWIEQIGSLLQNRTTTHLGIAVSLLVPTEALWRRAAWLMQPPFLQQLGVGPFTAGPPPSAAMVIWSAVYAAIALVLAVRIFSRRDL